MKAPVHALGFAVALALAGSAAFPQTQLDATMRPLDDVADAREMAAAAADDARPTERSERGDEERPNADFERFRPDMQFRGRQARNTDDVVERIDRDQESEREVEDYDVPADVEVPAADPVSQ